MMKRVSGLLMLILGAQSPGMSSAAAAPVAPPLAPEQLTIARVGPPSPHWVYVGDYSFNNEIDCRVYLYDGDNYRRLGQIDAGFFPGINLSPDGKTTVVSTTYFSRGGHGARTDVVEFTDNDSFAKTGEIVLPPKHAQTFAMMFTVAYSSDAHFLYTPYLTPAASFGVLDPLHHKILSEIDTAGCTLVYPWGPDTVSSICESGRLLTVRLNAQGKEASRAQSDPFFDVDKDPVFAQAVPLSDGYAWISFLGQVHEVTMAQDKPVMREPWSLVTGPDKGTWRPGGIQIGAVHPTLGRLYLPMHRGGDGSHKDGGSEIWVFDLKTHQRSARWPIDTQKLGAVVSVQVSHDAAPLLFAATDAKHLLIFDALTGRLKHDQKDVGQTPQLLLNP